MDNIAGILVIFILVLVVASLIFREFVCWYWKINQTVGLLTEIRELLAVQLKVADRDKEQKQPDPIRLCLKCGARQSAENNFCDSCGEKVS
jgi:hypothetical protein